MGRGQKDTFSIWQDVEVELVFLDYRLNIEEVGAIEAGRYLAVKQTEQSQKIVEMVARVIMLV